MFQITRVELMCARNSMSIMYEVDVACFFLRLNSFFVNTADVYRRPIGERNSKPKCWTLELDFFHSSNCLANDILHEHNRRFGCLSRHICAMK